VRGERVIGLQSKIEPALWGLTTIVSFAEPPLLSLWTPPGTVLDHRGGALPLLSGPRVPADNSRVTLATGT